jgi:DNA-binding transcriptional ArsR family regulator
MKIQDPHLVFAALSDPTRLGILALLRERPHTVGEIVRSGTLAGPTITRHLDALEQAGLIRRSKRAQERICELQHSGFQTARQWLHPFEAFWSASLDQLDQLLNEENAP